MSKEKILHKFITSKGSLNSQNAKYLEEFREQLTSLTTCPSNDLKEKLYWIYTDKYEFTEDDFDICETCGQKLHLPFQNTSVGYCWDRRHPERRKHFCNNRCAMKNEEWKNNFLIDNEIFTKTENIKTLKEIKTFLNANLFMKNGQVNGNVVKSFHPSFKNRIEKFSNLKTGKITEKIYWILNNLKDYPRKCCCGKPITKFKGFSYDLHDYCSVKCSSNSDEKKNKIRETWIQRSEVSFNDKNPWFKYKDYIMPSGKTIRVQGYEPQALDILLKTYDENNICVHKGVPIIPYYLNDKRLMYYPDFFIPKENLIIEVKSEWTLNLHKETNDLKFEAVKSAGYNFKLMIMDK